mmetsp:Transcript_31963/g.73461  ORF Transcript_31963/g.73461 Transcript_31963/m.73461 type:complete len:92 (+) Transcript_31963:2268-2543(+)
MFCGRKSRLFWVRSHQFSYSRHKIRKMMSANHRTWPLSTLRNETNLPDTPLVLRIREDGQSRTLLDLAVAILSALFPRFDASVVVTEQRGR